MCTKDTPSVFPCRRWAHIHLKRSKLSKKKSIDSLAPGPKQQVAYSFQTSIRTLFFMRFHFQTQVFSNYTPRIFLASWVSMARKPLLSLCVLCHKLWSRPAWPGRWLICTRSPKQTHAKKQVHMYMHTCTKMDTHTHISQIMSDWKVVGAWLESTTFWRLLRASWSWTLKKHSAKRGNWNVGSSSSSSSSPPSQSPSHHLHPSYHQQNEKVVMAPWRLQVYSLYVCCLAGGLLLFIVLPDRLLVLVTPGWTKISWLKNMYVCFVETSQTDIDI